MTTIKITGNMAKWRIPRKSTKNAAQGIKLEHKIFIQTREIDKKKFFENFHLLALQFKMEINGHSIVIHLKLYFLQIWS